MVNSERSYYYYYMYCYYYYLLRPSHQTLKICPSGWGKGLRCCPSLRYFIKHICQNKLDNERSLLAKHEAVRPTKYLVWKRNGSKNGVPSFDYLRLVADDNIVLAVVSTVYIVQTSFIFLNYCPSNKIPMFILRGLLKHSATMLVMSQKCNNENNNLDSGV